MRVHFIQIVLQVKVWVRFWKHHQLLTNQLALHTLCCLWTIGASVRFYPDYFLKKWFKLKEGCRSLHEHEYLAALRKYSSANRGL